MAVLYVIENAENGHLKIGSAADVEKRLATLQSANSAELRVLRQFPGSCYLEHRIHRDLSQYNIRGEWFYPDDEVWKYLDALHNYESEIIGGYPCLVLWRDEDSADCETDHCPFCGHRHGHSEGDGHRATHCYGDKINRTITAANGTVFNQRLGYIIKSRSNQKAGVS